ncbi:uncharacterized protein LOC106066510 [Biomphalaria glabrata]|uniref:Uncharacterized protein LOC106066510 n=1 Tax=Biomphalaria glabrata TaxID=6526 RepID=A0A9W2Z5F9_BIOGL|nr:uncharacterized protein LOC106066510 [Biomphalaria glabrata]
MALSNTPGIDSDYLSFTFPAQIKSAAAMATKVNNDPCSAPSACDLSQFCTFNQATMRLECHSLCSNYTCPENAECFINTFNNPQCKCKSSDKYVYSGQDCAVAVEKLALGVNEIIAIAVSVGLAAIILTILIVLAIVYRRRRHKKSPTSSDESDFETRQSPLDGAAPLQPALYGRFETLRLPRVSRQPSQLKRQSSLAYQESIYPPDARFPYSGSDIAGRQSAGESQGRFRDIRASQFGRGLPLAHNPRANWNARWSSWSDGGESA